MDSDILPIMTSVADTVKWSGIRRSRLYLLIKTGEIEARKIGARTLIVVGSVVRYLDNLPQARGNTVRPVA